MIRLRRSEDRGRADHGWLDSRHTFSFADYHDPEHMGFRALRVVNEDVVKGGGGFPPHPHRDMEIVSYVLSGALEHRDSLGTGSVIRPGDVQRMSAGTGVVHSEYNASRTEPVHFLQIWIKPSRTGTRPGYEQKTFADEAKRGRFCVVASPDGREGSVTIGQDALLLAADLAAGERARHTLAAGRHAWLQVVKGAVTLGEHTLGAGDGAAVNGEDAIALAAGEPASVLLFDLA